MKANFYKSLTGFFGLMLMILVMNAQAQQYQYSGNWGKRGFTIEQQNNAAVVVNFSVDEFTVGDITINGEKVKTVELPGVFLPGNEGAPNLPGTGRYIAIPNGATASLEIVDYRTEVIQGLEIGQAPRIPKENEDGLEYPKNMSIYQTNALYPESPVKLSEPTLLRGVNAVMLGFTPFQYNPVSKELIVFKDIRVKITLSNGNNQFGETRLRSRWFDPLLQDLLLNPDVLPKVDYNKSYANTDDTGYEYLIITPNDAVFQQWADTIKKFRTEQGIYTGIKTLADVGATTPADPVVIENYINNAYNTWTIPPVAVLLLGDYGTNINNTITSPIWDSYCVSDNIYADVNNDDMPDIVFARMTAQNAAQLEVMIRKFIDYEVNPPTAEDFYAHPISALGWQTERWFQICSEVIGGFWKNQLGKDPVRINAVYQGNPASDPWSTATNTNTVVNYFGPTGLDYIPATPQGLNGWTGGTPAMVNTAINNGSFMLQHRDHGFENGWGEPAYESTHISGLTNTDLCFIMSVNCLTGKYNYPSEVFAEKFHRYTYNGQPSGALGLLAASEVSYSFVNDAFIWGVYDNMWPEFMPTYGSTPDERGILPAFGNAAGKYFLQQSSWPYNTSNKEVTYNLFHHHGDAFLTVFSEVPQSLTVVHNPIIYTGVTTFEVTANAGALIALTLNGEIIGTGVGTGAPVTITIPGTQLPPDFIHVVATLQNYLRYEGDVEVIPPTGPYVIKDLVSLSDPTGNNNGKADYGEVIDVNLSMKNVGVMVANNIVVSVTTTDTEVTLTDNSENFGVINAGSSVLINNAFSFTVSNSVEDGHVAAFQLTATDGTNTWTSNFNVVLNAPALSVGSISISDPTGNNNNRLDPGETAEITIVTDNEGQSDLLNAIAQLQSADTSIVVQTGSLNLNTISANGNVAATFTVNVSPFAIYGQSIMMSFTSGSGNYQLQETFYQMVGIVSEDWETGNFLKFSWNHPNPTWTISNVNPYEGVYCAKSAPIQHNGSTFFEIELNVLADDSIAFYRKVSSESGYDFLEFYIDNNKLGQWSGNVAWSRVSFPVTEGSHTFKWQYKKDNAAIGGSDCAWVDYILFPPVTVGLAPLTALISSTPNMICEGSSATLNAMVSGGNMPYTYAWSPTTNLSNPAIGNPVANPTATTSYSVTVSDINGNSVSATFNLVVNPVPTVTLTSIPNACVTWGSHPLSGGLPLGGTYTGTSITSNTFYPASAGVGTHSVNYTYTTGAGCTAQATGSVFVDPCAGIEDPGMNTRLEIYPNPNTGSFDLEINPSGDEVLNLQVVNAMGMVIYEYRDLNVNGKTVLPISLSNAAAGVYYLKIQGTQTFTSKQFVVEY